MYVCQSSRGTSKSKPVDVNALISELTAELEEDSDVRSVVTSKSLRSVSGIQLKKKDKKKIQHAVRQKRKRK